MGGAEISVQTLAEEQQKNGIETIVITLSDKNCIDFVNGVKVYYIRHPNFYWIYKPDRKIKILVPLRHILSIKNPFMDRKLEEIIRLENPDIVHTNNLIGLSYFFWKAVKKNKKPLVHTLRDYYLLCWKSSLYSKNKNCGSLCRTCRLLSFPKKFFSKYVDAVAGTTNFILRRHFDEGFFLDCKKYMIGSPIKTCMNIFPKKVTNNPLTFAFIGLINKTKGIEELLEIFSVPAFNSNLIVLGKGSNNNYEEDLKSRYSSENIRFMGFSDIPGFMPKIDVIIVPSLWNEPFGRVIIEAYSYGIPVIGSRRGGIPELVEDGRTGFIFDPDKNRDLESKIKIFSGNPGLIPQMSENCISRSEQYSARETTIKYTGLYKNLLSDKR